MKHADFVRGETFFTATGEWEVLCAFTCPKNGKLVEAQKIDTGYTDVFDSYDFGGCDKTDRFVDQDALNLAMDIICLETDETSTSILFKDNYRDQPWQHNKFVIEVARIIEGYKK